MKQLRVEIAPSLKSMLEKMSITNGPQNTHTTEQDGDKSELLGSLLTIMKWARKRFVLNVFKNLVTFEKRRTVCLHLRHTLLFWVFFEGCFISSVLCTQTFSVCDGLLLDLRMLSEAHDQFHSYYYSSNMLIFRQSYSTLGQSCYLKIASDRSLFPRLERDALD